ncbi:hypothetical protein BO78DRAFT_404235 [Aspergillus sclerotiicarbonarius CBS 121057]|uniref:Alpha/beta hydrolase fold-3 domain-containing protein n=1 Tax=Aspergillus sclerotiicarbonarius (strain CBS 121057 / IBT 28362) TaxID=1448318 RepID=A0A319EJK3_ASPSB|nr:hypothetical protein BO78DRAFT_404235 [Aspergillus sclerotiicarbonarius CBS 121057]
MLYLLQSPVEGQGQGQPCPPTVRRKKTWLLLYFLSGAYCILALSGHFSHVGAIIEELKVHAVELLRYSIETLEKQPSNIILQGDTSGAHLALSVLSHISHPHPTVPCLALTEGLAGALLLSPWIDFRTHFTSFSARALELWSRKYIGDNNTDPYIYPALAPGVLVDSIVGLVKTIKFHAQPIVDFDWG